MLNMGWRIRFLPLNMGGGDPDTAGDGILTGDPLADPGGVE